VAGTDPLATFEALFRTVCEERDAEAADALWARDEDVTLFGSETSDRARGPAAVRGHLQSFAQSRRRVRFVWEDAVVHDEGDVAWVTATGTLDVDGNATAYQACGVFVRRDERWLWHTFSGCEPR
jgi:ketosteroid isomerase-like protein